MCGPQSNVGVIWEWGWGGVCVFCCGLCGCVSLSVFVCVRMFVRIHMCVCQGVYTVTRVHVCVCVSEREREVSKICILSIRQKRKQARASTIQTAARTLRCGYGAGSVEGGGGGARRPGGGGGAQP